MSKNGPSHAISGVFVFLLLGVFAVFSTVMVVLGAKAYKATADRAAEHNADRIASAYVRSMVRADDDRDSLRVEEIGGLSAVTMHYDYDGEEYLTRIYVYGGKLREWFSYAEADFEPADGEAVCAADEMQASLSGHLLSVCMRHGDKWTNVDIALRSAAN
jgi:hypothetical protein